MMDDFGNQILYSHFNPARFALLEQLCGVSGAYGYCNYSLYAWINAARQQII